MEPIEAALRYKLILGKFRVGRVVELGAALEFSIELPGLGQLIVTGPKADIKEGDLLTLYTEVFANALSSQSSIQ